MKVSFELRKGNVFSVLLVFGIVIGAIGVFAVVSGNYNYENSIPDPGHGGDEILVDVDGIPGNGEGEMTLQEAFNLGLLGKGSGGNVVTGKYTGDGSQVQDIVLEEIGDKKPELVWVAVAGDRGPPIYRIDNMGLHSECSDSSERWCFHPENLAGDQLFAFEGGFSVSRGPGFDLNFNGAVYEFYVLVGGDSEIGNNEGTTFGGDLCGAYSVDEDGDVIVTFGGCVLSDSATSEHYLDSDRCSDGTSSILTGVKEEGTNVAYYICVAS